MAVHDRRDHGVQPFRGPPSSRLRQSKQDASAVPGGEDHINRGADHERNPTAVRDLEQVGYEKGEIDQEEYAGDTGNARHPPAPPPPRDRDQEDRRDRHRARHRKAVRCRQPNGRAEADHERKAREHQQPVERGHVDLAHRRRGGVHHAQAWAELEPDRLIGHGEDGRDQRLRCDDRGDRRERHQRIERPRRGRTEEGILTRRGVREQHGAFSEVAEEQAGEDQREPGEADRPLSEVAHVGVERLGSREAEHDRAEDGDAAPAVQREESNRITRIDRGENRRIARDTPYTDRRDDHEPEREHRSEDAADAPGADGLQREQPDQNRDGERHDVGLESERRHRQSFDGAQHGDCGRDDAVAVEQRRSGDA